MSINRYIDHYNNQDGYGVFNGTYTQEGFGLGALLGGLLRSAVPFLSKSILPIAKKTAKAIGKEGLKLGRDISMDILSGQSPKKAVKRQGRKRLLAVEDRIAELGRPAPKRKRLKRTAKRRDIFS